MAKDETIREKKNNDILINYNHSAMDSFMSLQNLYTEALSSIVIVLGNSFGKYIGLDEIVRWHHHKYIGALINKVVSSFSFCHLRTEREEGG